MALYWPDHAQCVETDLDMLRHAHIQGPSAHVDINNICVAALCTLRALLARTAHSHGENVSGVWVRVSAVFRVAELHIHGRNTFGVLQQLQSAP